MLLYIVMMLPDERASDLFEMSQLGYEIEPCLTCTEWPEGTTPSRDTERARQRLLGGIRTLRQICCGRDFRWIVLGTPWSQLVLAPDELERRLELKVQSRPDIPVVELLQLGAEGATRGAIAWAIRTDRFEEAVHWMEHHDERTCHHNAAPSLAVMKPARVDTPPHSLKLAVCMTSYRRLIDLHRQLWSMLEQSYTDVHVYAAVKGMPEATFRQAVEPMFRHWVTEGRLTLRYSDNKNQLSNFLDAIRDCDISRYDVFLKIDDDDLYGRDYCLDVCRFHRMLPPGFSSYAAGATCFLHSRDGISWLEPGVLSIFGPTIAMSEQVVEKLIECERYPERMGEIDPELQTRAYGYREDRLMHVIMNQVGACNRAAYLSSLGEKNHVIIRRDNASVMRGGLVPSEVFSRNYTINRQTDGNEGILQMEHPMWRDIVQTLGKRARRLNGGDEADIVEQNASRIVLKWDRWGTEAWEKRPDGVFELDET